MSPGKKRKRLISPTPFNQFSSSFHQNYRTVSSHIILVTSDLENVGQYHNLQICSSLMAHSARSLYRLRYNWPSSIIVFWYFWHCTWLVWVTSIISHFFFKWFGLIISASSRCCYLYAKYDYASNSLYVLVPTSSLPNFKISSMMYLHGFLSYYSIHPELNSC